MSRGPGCVSGGVPGGTWLATLRCAPGLRYRFGWPPEKAEVDGSSNFYALGLRQKNSLAKMQKIWHLDKMRAQQAPLPRDYRGAAPETPFAPLALCPKLSLDVNLMRP